MNELKKTGLIFLVATVLYAYLAVYEDHEIDDLGGPQRLVRAAAVELTEVEVALTPAEGAPERFALRRREATQTAAPAEGWDLVQDGGAHAADAAALQHLLHRLGTFDVTRVVDDGTGDMKAFGLDAPVARVAWKAPEAEEAGHRAGALVFGGRSPVGALRFVRREGDPRVFVAESWKVALLSKEASHYRDKRLLPPVALADLTRLEVRLAAEAAPRSFAPDAAGAWRATSPRAFPLDRAALTDLVSDLDALRAREFLGPGTPEVRAEYALAEPAIAATLATTAGEELTIELGERDPERSHLIRVFSSRLAAVVTVDADLLRRLSEPLEELREKFFLRGRLDDVQRLVVTVDGRTEEFARISGPWKSLTDPTEDHGEIVGAALDALGTLRARTWKDEPGDLAAYGLAEPPVTVRVFGGEGAELVLSASPAGQETGPWVQVEGDPTVYRTQGTSFLEKLKVLVAVLTPAGPAPEPGADPEPEAAP